jgi:glycerophosphoryl diester phosphodiesterase
VYLGLDRAIRAGAAMVELDVRRTAERVLVVHHDTITKREDGTHVSPPVLEDVLKHVAGRVALDLELKEAGYESEVVALVTRYVALERLVITSFIDGAIQAVREANAAIATGLIVGRHPLRSGVVPAVSDVFPFNRLAAVRADFLAPSQQLDFTGIRARAAKRGIPLLLWTVNDPGKLEAARADPRLLGVVTDNLDVCTAPSR